MHHDAVTIVSGLPRSGTSMMMRMLEAGGMGVLTDHIRTADVDNPKGYYEFERVKQIKDDQAWLDDAKGKAVKMVSALLIDLPPGYQYKVIFMRRRIEEILASQRQMLIRQGKPADAVADDRMAAMFEKHIVQMKAWLVQQPNLEVVYVDYNDMLRDPLQPVQAIDALLGHRLDTDEMLKVVDPALYRQRR
jgi:hypothetical protein